MKVAELKNPKGLMKTCAKLAGITNDLNSDDYLVVGLMLKEEFGHLSSAWLKDAFIKYGAGKLGSFEHYNSFTTKFVSQVIVAYKEYRAKQNTKRIVEPSKQIEMKQETKKEEAEKAWNFIDKCYSKGEEVMFANWTLAFKWGEHIGELNVSPQDKEQILNQIKRDVDRQKKESRAKGQKFSQLLNLLSTDTGLKIECRKLVLKDYFKRKYEEDSN